MGIALLWLDNGRSAFERCYACLVQPFAQKIILNRLVNLKPTTPPKDEMALAHFIRLFCSKQSAVHSDEPDIVGLASSMLW